MKKNYICEELAIVLETSFVDPQTVDFLIRLQRTAERKGQKEQVELIKEGLMQMLSQEIEKATQKNVKDGVIYLVGDIVLELSDNNPEACKMIIQETDFIDKYISYLNSLSKSQIKNWHGYYFTTLSDNLPSEDQNLLFEKGVIQTIVNLDFKDKECSLEYFKIESSIIEAENQRLKDGEQHPYMKQLSEDGTLTKILQAFINEKNEDKQRILMNSLGSLYKAAPLPIDTQKLIIDFLRKEKKFEIMSYLAECPSNHDTILMNDYEQKFFQKSLTEMHSIRIIYSIIKYGNEINKKKVSAAVKEEVLKLNDEKNIEKLTNKYHWDEKEKQEIEYKTQEILKKINESSGVDQISKVSSKKIESKMQEQHKDQQQLNDQMKSQEKQKMNEKFKKKYSVKETNSKKTIKNDKLKGKKKENIKQNDNDKTKQISAEHSSFTPNSSSKSQSRNTFSSSSQSSAIYCPSYSSKQQMASSTSKSAHSQNDQKKILSKGKGKVIK